MAAVDRVFGWDVTVFKLASNTELPAAAVDFANPLTIFTECRLQTETRSVDGRGRQEFWDHPLPYGGSWRIEVGAVLDAAWGSLTEIYLIYGVGPFWVQLSHPSVGTGSYRGKVIIGGTETILPDGPASTGMTLLGQGALELGTV